LSVGLLATIVVTVLVTRVARRALEVATGPASVTQEMHVPTTPASTGGARRG